MPTNIRREAKLNFNKKEITFDPSNITEMDEDHGIKSIKISEEFMVENELEEKKIQKIGYTQALLMNIYRERK